MSDIIRDNQRRAYQNKLYILPYEPLRDEPSPIQLIPNALPDIPFEEEPPTVEGIPLVPGQKPAVKRYKLGEIA